MIIDQFKIKISSNEESKIVQETLFKSGYSWESISEVIYPKDLIYLVFRYSDYYKVNKIFYNFDDDCDNDIPLITFNQFNEKYGLIAERREKLKKLNMKFV